MNEAHKFGKLKNRLSRLNRKIKDKDAMIDLIPMKKSRIKEIEDILK